MATRLVLILAVVGLGCKGDNGDGPVVDDPKTNLTVLNANILYCDPLEEEVELYLARRDLLIEELTELQPDVMAIQEASNCYVFGDAEKTIEAVVDGLADNGLSYGSYFWISEGYEGIWEEGLAFIWNEQTVDVDENEVLCSWLSDHYNYPGMEIIKSLCRVTVAVGDDETMVFNTHLDARDEDVREAQTLELTSLLQERLPDGHAGVFTGDLNRHDAEGYFTPDGWTLLKKDHVDYIFVKNIPSASVVETTVIALKDKGISDHNGLWLDVDLD